MPALMVKAKALGVYKKRRVRPGQQFLIDSPKEFSHKWMVAVGWKPPEASTAKPPAVLKDPPKPGATGGKQAQIGSGEKHPTHPSQAGRGEEPLVAIEDQQPGPDPIGGSEPGPKPKKPAAKKPAAKKK